MGLKIGLPLLAAVVVAYVVIWSRTHLAETTINPVQAAAGAGQSTSAVNVSQVKYDGVDSKNRPYTITAESATQPDQTQQNTTTTPNTGGNAAAPSNATTAANTAGASNSGQTQPAPAKKTNAPIYMKQIEADMTMTGGAWVAVTADDGVYDRDSGIVNLKGNVNLFHDTGLSFATDAATVDVNNDEASGDQPIEGQRPDGELAAEGFQVRNDGQTVIFTGRAFLKLYPNTKSPTSSSSKTSGSGG
jgi:lipopolysaccharide export system protein LptC